MSIRVHSWLAFVRLVIRDCLERRNRFVDFYPWQFIFKEDCFLRRKRRRIVKRRDRDIDTVRVFAVLEKQMRAAAGGKRTNPIRVGNLARLTLLQDQILARHRSPRHMRGTCASPAIDAMTIDQSNWPALQQVSCPAANASTTELHMTLVKFLWITQDCLGSDKNISSNFML